MLLLSGMNGSDWVDSGSSPFLDEDDEWELPERTPMQPEPIPEVVEVVFIMFICPHSSAAAEQVQDEKSGSRS